MTAYTLVLIQTLLAPDFFGGNALPAHQQLDAAPMTLEQCEAAGDAWRQTSYSTRPTGHDPSTMAPEDVVTVRRDAVCIPIPNPDPARASDGLIFESR